MLHPPPPLPLHFTVPYIFLPLSGDPFWCLKNSLLIFLWKRICCEKFSLFFLEIFLLQFSFEGFFTAYRTLGFFGFWFWGVLFCLFLDFKISFHCFLTYIVSVKKSVAILIFVSFEDNVSFSPLWLVLRFPLVIGFQWFVLSFGKVCFFFSLLSFVLFVESAAWITN